MEGGRKTACTNGYRPQFEIPEVNMSTSASQTFIGRNKVYPGETVVAEIKMLSPQFFLGKLSVGKEFNLSEGRTIVARGTIIEVLTKSLLPETKA